MAMSTNNADREGDGAARDVDGGNGADDAFFEWLKAQLAPSNLMDRHEGQGSNDVTPEGSSINDDPAQGSNNVSYTSDHDVVNDTNYASAISLQGHHVDGSATHVLNGDPHHVIGPTDLYSCDYDDDDWIAEVIESGILDIREKGR